MSDFYNRVKFTTATTGTGGTLTVGSAVAGFRTPAQASIPDGTILSYVIEDAANAWETGWGVYTVSGTTLSRNVRQSSNSNTAINLSGTAVVRCTVLAEDMQTPFAILNSDYNSVTIANNGTDDAIIDTELVDDFDLVSLTGDVITVGQDGWYAVDVVLSIVINGGSPVSADGHIDVFVSNTGPFDNLHLVFSTSSGVIYSGAAFVASCSVQMLASYGNWLSVQVANYTGHSMDVTTQEIRVRQLPGTSVGSTDAQGLTRNPVMWHDQSIATVGNSFSYSLDYFQFFGVIAQQLTAANGDTFKNSFVCAPGTYVLNLLTKLDNYCGILDVYVDNVLKGSFDLYSAGGVQNTIKTTSSFSLAGGYHVLKGVVNGKNGSSVGYSVLMTRMYLTPSAY